MSKLTQAEKLIDEMDLDGWFFISNGGSDVHASLLTGGLLSHARSSFMITPPGEPNTILIARLEYEMVERRVRELGLDIDVYPFKTSEEELELIRGAFHGKNEVALNYAELESGFLTETYIPGTDILKYGEYQNLKNFLPEITFVSAQSLIFNLRMRKTVEEIKDHEKAVKLTIAILDDLPNFMEKEMTEKELAAEIEYRIAKDAKKGFETIVATGPGSADPHYMPRKKKVAEGVLLIDMGIKVGLCASDITRTFYIGKPSEDFVEAYEAVYEAKEAAERILKAGAHNKKVAQVARDKFTELGYDHEKLFIHGLGHPIGINVGGIGPGLTIRASEDAVLVENSIYTIEPGLYWQGKYGIRLEDDYVIKKNGNQCFAKASRDVTTI
ncbi:MAG: M24 family metallopeptidase [Candidatus Odinarchaeota archaeon]